MTCLDAMKMAEEFYQKDFEPWAVRVNAREHVFLYISKYGSNYLPQIYALEAGQKEPELMVFKAWSLGRWLMGRLRRMGPGNRACLVLSVMRLPDNIGRL